MITDQTPEATTLSARARAGFDASFSRPELGVWSAPGRVNLIGEHTDYNDGFVFPFAIELRTAVALGLRGDRVARVASAHSPDVIEMSLDTLDPAAMTGWSAYVFGVVWALGIFGAPLEECAGVDLFIDSDVPIGAGLSSSAALECAVAVALNDAWGLGMDRATLARVGQRAENVAVGAPTGIMDQSAAMLGTSDAGVFLDCRSLDAQVIPLGFAAAGLELLVIDTHDSHDLATGGYAARRASCEAAAHALGVDSLGDVTAEDLPRADDLLDAETFRRLRHVITENQRVLDTVRTLREHGPAAIGALLNDSHLSMRDDFEISTPQLDLAVGVAQAMGAIGARMTGGGFGGAAIALLPADLVPAVSAAIPAAFAEYGYTAPALFTVRASDGARAEG